jgi:potassium/sodium efflux P-type ATPase
MNSHNPIWSLTPQEVYRNLTTTSQGLNESEANLRLKQYGYNELPEPQTRPLILRFIDQLTHFMALLLWVAGILAFVSQIPELGWAIWAVIWINALFSFWQEFQAEKALTALKQVLPAQVKVYRDNTLCQIPARELVTGDVIQLEEGDKISADARLVESQSLYLDVSILTGESLPVPRSHELVTAENMRASDATNLIFAGSTVASGRGLGVVYATGTHTEFGQVAHLTANVKREPSTLEIQISKVVHIITLIAISMGVIIFLLTKFLVGMGIRESFIFAIGIIVAFVPEGLLPTVSLALAIGVKRMARKNALVRRLSAVETLSATTVICTDKTGTLTKNEMTVRQLWIPGAEVNITGVGYEPKGEVEITNLEFKSESESESESESHVKLLLAGAALCTNAKLNHLPGSSQWQELGDPTEAALLVVAIKGGFNLEKLQNQVPRLREIPFDSHRRMMTVLVENNDNIENIPDIFKNSKLIFTKGSPLDVLQHSDFIFKSGKQQEITEQERQQIETENDKFASQGYRVLAVAARQGNQELLAEDNDSLEQNLTFLGLVAMIDPPRPEVADAIALCHLAGIQVTMITGDYGLTAAAIAQKVGLLNGKSNGKIRVINGEQLSHLSDAQLRQILHKQKQGLVFARVMPEQKLRLVEAYKNLGHIVAVTGDGVNDAPALRAANIGIAMGMNGTDVAREAADIVLVDDNFATIVEAIEQGRAVYQNIRKFITYILASNAAEFLPFLFMVLFKIPPALVILQILAIDLGTDMLPALALGAERPERGSMTQPPRKKSQQLLDLPLMLRAYCFLGLLEGLAGMAGFFLVWLSNGYGIRELQAIAPSILSHSANATTMAIYHQATTMTLAVIVACQDGNVFACRSERFSIFRLGFFTNRLIWLGIAVEWALILSIIYSPTLQKIFSTASLTAIQWLTLLICPPFILLADEIRKKIVRSNKSVVFESPIYH